MRDHRSRVAASILTVLLLGAYFVASTGGGGALPVPFLINAVVAAFAFWFPARWIGRPGDILRHWKPLLVWLLAWTLVWDLATAGIIGTRAPFEAWWRVYPSGVAFFALLLLLHGAVARRFTPAAAEPSR